VTNLTLTLSRCRFCGGYHSGTCPRVKAIEYHQDGSVKRVEFYDDTATFGNVPAGAREPGGL
jgi:hypothetical protein